MIFLPTVKRVSSNGGESYEKYRNPALLDRKSGVTTGYPALRLDAVFLLTTGFGILKVEATKCIWVKTWKENVFGFVKDITRTNNALRVFLVSFGSMVFLHRQTSQTSPGAYSLAPDRQFSLCQTRQQIFVRALDGSVPRVWASSKAQVRP